MAASVNDKISQVTSSNTGRPVVTTLSGAGHSIGGTSVTIAAATNWSTTTGIHFSIYETTTVGGATVKDASTQTDWKGTLASTTISNMTITGGTDRDYSAGAIVEITPTARWAKDLYDWGIAQHNQDGTHSAITATSITATTGTFNSVTIAGTASAEGWSPLGATPNTVTANGNRSYDLVFNSNDLTDTLSPGMRIKATRTVTAPTQCASLNGTNHYFSKTTPSGAAQTDDITVSAWIKPTSYAAGVIMGKRTATNGWDMSITATGTLRIIGINASNFRMWSSYQSIPLNKWVHVAATLDMSGNTSATNKLYIDGVEVPAVLSSSGAPSALVSAGDLTIGAYTGGAEFFPGKIAQVAAYSAVLSAATIKASMTQTLTGSETNLISAYSLSNSLTDLNTGNANNLTAQNSAVATATDSPFAGGSVGTTEYGIVTAATFSTNTTLTVQVPEGYALPTTGGISAVSYSISKIPYGFNIDPDKWTIRNIYTGDYTTTSTSYAQVGGTQITLPTGSWRTRMKTNLRFTLSGNNEGQGFVALSTSTSATSDDSLAHTIHTPAIASLGGSVYDNVFLDRVIAVSSATTYYQIFKRTVALSFLIVNADTYGVLEIEFAYL